MVSFEFGSGDRVAWQIEGTAQNFYLHYKWQERLEAAGFPCKLFPYQQNMKDGGRHSALSREWTFSTEHCEQTKLDTADTAILLRRLIDLLQSEGDDHGAAIADFNRITIESAMDALDRYRETGEGDEIFDYFGEPRDYWGAPAVSVATVSIRQSQSSVSLRRKPSLTEAGARKGMQPQRFTMRASSSWTRMTSPFLLRNATITSSATRTAYDFAR